MYIRQQQKKKRIREFKPECSIKLRPLNNNFLNRLIIGYSNNPTSAERININEFEFFK